MLIILLATCERALEAFAEAKTPVRTELVADLERVVAGIRQELDSRPSP